MNFVTLLVNWDRKSTSKLLKANLLDDLIIALEFFAIKMFSISLKDHLVRIIVSILYQPNVHHNFVDYSEFNQFNIHRFFVKKAHNFEGK